LLVVESVEIDRSPQCRITPRFPTMLVNARLMHNAGMKPSMLGSSSFKIKWSFIVAKDHVVLQSSKKTFASHSHLVFRSSLMEGH
jgi:hypothetical protein